MSATYAFNILVSRKDEQNELCKFSSPFQSHHHPFKQNYHANIVGLSVFFFSCGNELELILAVLSLHHKPSYLSFVGCFGFTH